MITLSSILGAVTSRLLVDQKKTEAIASIITRETGVLVSVKDLKIMKGSVLLTVAPTVKLAVMIKREAILTACKAQRLDIQAIS